MIRLWLPRWFVYWRLEVAREALKRARRRRRDTLVERLRVQRWEWRWIRTWM